ncbi:MAG: Gfo/Idh/MocA family oxidoreductase [Aphanocapsa sp. GSE-SYN-MK-11-07L]|jgi:predicted dehydrogenase|nr:Gfo/Idh/MocA family oxidoreductase [Aphanocapsa sp. GSE-SYN-MK-11-07L]
MKRTQVAIVGCGFVADYYVKTLAAHPQLELRGVMDQVAERSAKFSAYHSVPVYKSLPELLADEQIEIVLNLTNPRSHYQVSKACLLAGKHVYSEKPLAMDFAEAEELVGLAEQLGLQLSSAPCSLLGETAQTLWKALRENQIGQVRVVYAEMDDGLVHKMPYQQWLSESGTPWPYKDEFEVGCTLEHAGYYLTWLVAFFGPATSVTAFSTCLIPDKETSLPLDLVAPDFSVACIQFTSGVVARLTCSIVVPHDHTLRIVGDDGVLSTKDCWYYRSPVFIKRMITIRRKTFMNPLRQNLPLLKSNYLSKFKYKGSQQMDFSRGVVEMAEAIAENRPSRLSARYALHVNEITLAIQNAWENNCTYKLKSTFAPIAPMTWAK